MTMDINALFATQPQAPAPAPQFTQLPVAAPQFAPAVPQAPQNQEQRLSLVAAAQGLHMATPQRNAAYFQEGNYIVSFQSAKGIQSNDGKGPLAIFEWKVERSTNPNIQPGYVGSHVIKLMGNRYALSDLRGIIVAMAGLNETTDKARIETEIMGIDPNTGMPNVYTILGMLEKGAPQMVNKQVLLRCSSKHTRPNAQNPQGGTFTVHAYSPVPA